MPRLPFAPALVLILAGLAAATPAAADALADIQKSGTLKVGVFADFPPFSSVGSDRIAWMSCQCGVTPLPPAMRLTCQPASLVKFPP